MLKTIDGRDIFTEIVILIAGRSQDGIQLLGHMLATQSGRSEMGVITSQTYPATISGGDSIFQVRIGSKAVKSSGDTCDFFLVFYENLYKEYLHMLRPGGTVIYDKDQFTPPMEDRKKYNVVGIPLTSLTIETLGGSARNKGKNMTALGFLVQALGMDVDRIDRQMRDTFKPKGDTIYHNAKNAFSAGYAYDVGNALRRIMLAHDETDGARKSQVTANGNTAIVLGAITAGIRFGAAYPITPASSIMEELRKLLPRFGGMFIQAEDEIAAIAMALGAGYGGRVTITCTSGPGLSLKMECLGWGIMAEIPVLIVDVQRGGPSTGMPTKVEQSDLLAACFGGHGDCARVVMAPSSVWECFRMTIDAVNIAREYSIPVIMLSDTSLATRIETFPMPDIDHLSQDLTPRIGEVDTHLPYPINNRGVSEHVPPGTVIRSGVYPVVTGLEHGPQGHPNGQAANHALMSAKRMRKINTLQRNLPPLEVYGAEDGELLVMCWGSARGPVEEAVDLAATNGMRVSSACLRYLSPFPENTTDVMTHFKKIIVIELNVQGQLAMLLRAQTALPHIISCSKPGGLSLKVNEAMDFIRREYERPVS